VLEKCPSAIVSSSYWHVTGGDPVWHDEPFFSLLYLSSPKNYNLAFLVVNISTSIIFFISTF
jgi:hypothetical protein